MVRLSVNVNKVATLRNSRGGSVPSVVEAVRVCLAAGAPGITVHPRADCRHITPQDVADIAAELSHLHQHIEYNLEGDPRPDFLDLVCQIRPHQCTLVPVQPGEITSQAGWSTATSASEIRRVVDRLHAAGVRVSLFVDPELPAVEWAAQMKADRVELYTEPYARAFEHGGWQLEESFQKYSRAAEMAHELELGVNAGHDLDLENLLLFRTLPYLDEVSIGHALISRALFAGLGKVVREYLDVLHPGQ
ncbi:MAG: pyridoxine 5'-phosphate synthase [Planctomycetes bacterium]|nr:pyridoxine 5'-phosphate synthase [Planctomycetota bacterium]